MEKKDINDLLYKWKNFSKVYYAILEAYKLGYKDGIEIEKYCKEMRKAEAIDINNMPSAI